LFQVALADETQRISLTTLPTPLIEEPEDDARELEITAQYQVKPVRKSHQWIGLEVLPSGILSAMSSGLVNLHPFTESGTIHQASVLSPLTCLRTVPTQSASGPSHMVLAGKNVELSMWDMERTFAAGIKAKDGKGEAGAKKRKKNELEEGEIWRAKRVSMIRLFLHEEISLRSSAAKQLLIDTDARRLHFDVYPTNKRRRSDWFHVDSGRHEIRVHTEIRHTAARARQ
jgi:hypothetical protein